jgi:hypothetical protein
LPHFSPTIVLAIAKPDKMAIVASTIEVFVLDLLECLSRQGEGGAFARGGLAGCPSPSAYADVRRKDKKSTANHASLFPELFMPASA